MPGSVEILLACYQGEAYLPKQLDSLFNQSFQNFILLVRDDGSTDATLAILDTYRKRYPDKIKIIPGGNRLGVVGNFNALLGVASADFLFFCDQDDIWEKDKIKLTLEQFKALDPGIPALVHTDLRVVDADLKTLHESFWGYSQINPKIGNQLNHLLVQNHVTGCTMAINQALKKLVFPIPEEALMHDWWISLAASVSGEIVHLPLKTVNYRQHSFNTLGASQISWKEGIKKFFFFLTAPSTNTKQADLRQKQASILEERFKKIMPAGKLELLKTFLKAPEMTTWERKWIYLSHRFFRQGFKKILPYLFQHRPF